MKLKIGVLLGGRSAEREVSLKTGEAVYSALLEEGYDAIKIDVGFDVAEKIKEAKIDLAFNALHGKWGEDGAIQGLLEILEIPYTGSGVLASALCMDKIATKKMLLFEKLPTPAFVAITKRMLGRQGLNGLASYVKERMNLPVVVKAASQGSSIGIVFVHREQDLTGAFEEAFKYDSNVLVEEFIEGTEVTASVLEDDGAYALPLIEIVSATGVYDYRAKYTVGMSEHIIPPKLDAATRNRIKELAVDTFETLGCSGLARVDFMVSNKNEPYILEVNTIPGMTETSLFPDAALAAGIEFPKLIKMLVTKAYNFNS